MTSRQRILAALNFQPVDRLPKDLAGMRSTGVSAFSYQSLRKALGLPFKPTRVYDTGQMLALPHVDVLDALGCDVVIVEGDCLTNAYEQPDLWQPYDFNGRIPGGHVRDRSVYRVDPDGTIFEGAAMSMPLGAYVFNSEHAGQEFILDGELPRPDLKQVRRDLEKALLTDQQIKSLRETCRRVREESDRAVFFWGQLKLELCIHGYGGLAIFPVLCLEDPDFIHELHDLHLDYALRNVRSLLPEIKDYVDVVGTDADDWGNQNSLMASPDTFRDLFLPYRKRHNAEIHRLAPESKTFLHSCGAIYPILDLIMQTGTDILNPVQWPAGGHTPQEWKDKVRGKMSFWGGGVDSQHTLPLGSLADIEGEVTRNVATLGKDSGYVFANIHNLLSEVSPEKIIALYRTAERVG
ncbi:MAG: uroporphyrinogen decarboxylase family protein [Cephaloticoccus sp.]|nr:uroporphyrinogen decarboxylase family protein [Cephaloticoccus sp.]MCF7759584.1 uroporphyrinogen decarboxylase family protein [Cephaloticoccus sp.]